MTDRDLFGNPVPSEVPKRTPAAERPPGQFGRPRRFTRAEAPGGADKAQPQQRPGHA